ncbi:MAG: metallophosphoesterase [Fulvivirga sp.]|nr:metallophosphoesterase [Fulvivirga sp.]
MKRLLALILLFISGCFEYNPNQIILDDDEKDLTRKHIARIQATPVPDTIKIAFMGDTQRFYDETVHFVEHVNQRDDLSFIIHGGDISDFGLVKEFKWVNDILSSSQVPYLTAVGNHDLLANGRKVYNRMYGANNYVFNYGNFRFIILDTNSREYGFNGNVPDLNWLQDMLNDNEADRETIVIGHIPPFDDDFDDALEMEYATILANDPHVNLSLYAHQHNFRDEEYYDDGVRYFVTTTTQDKGYALLKLWEGDFSIEIVNF